MILINRNTLQLGIRLKFDCKLNKFLKYNEQTFRKLSSKSTSYDIYTIPNLITISRIISSPLLAVAVVNDMKLMALGGCILAGFSDWLDGYIARKYNQSVEQSVLGGFLDPLADKAVIGALTAGLCWKGLLPLPLAGIIIGRDLALIAGSFFIRYRDMPPGAPFFDTTYAATFRITPTITGKINTALQFSLLGITLCHFSTGYPELPQLQPLWYVIGLATTGSGIEYMLGTGYKRLSKPSVGQVGKDPR